MSHGEEVTVDGYLASRTSPYQRSPSTRNDAVLRPWEPFLGFVLSWFSSLIEANNVLVIILIINAIAVLSEDRFLARSTSTVSTPVA